jgi:DNA-binding transcriptional LysR family regulator
VPGTDLIATVPRRFAEIQRHNRAIKFLPPPREIHGFKYLMIWHPRLHTDPAHVWLRGLIATAAAEQRRSLRLELSSRAKTDYPLTSSNP